MTSCKCCERIVVKLWFALSARLSTHSTLTHQIRCADCYFLTNIFPCTSWYSKRMGNDENNISLCSVYKICLISIIVGRMNCVSFCIHDFMTQHINDAKDENRMMRDRLNERRLFDGEKMYHFAAFRSRHSISRKKIFCPLIVFLFAVMYIFRRCL